MRKVFPSLLVSFMILLSACTFNNTYTNRKKDRQDAVAVAAGFFDHIKKHKYEATFGLFSEEFKKITSEEKVLEIYEYTNKHLGDLQETELVAWETKVVEGTDASANYALEYRNTYDSSTAKEVFRLVKNKEGRVKILYYGIDSDRFYKK
jgi:hypothetical protein